MRSSTRRPATLGAAAATYLDLGSEPALAVGSRSIGTPARRAVSIRWLSGTVLTGFTSFFLMGGALIAALNGQNLLIAPPSSEVGQTATGLRSGQKGDRLMPEPPAPSIREIVQVNTITRQDNRDLIQQRPFVRINAPLVAASAAGIDVPPYDPMAIIGQGANTDAPAAPEPLMGEGIYAADVDGQVVIQTELFPLGAVFADAAPVATTDVEMIVRQTANLLPDGGVQLAALAFAAPAAEYGATDDPFAALGARMRSIPENVTFVTRSDNGASRDERILAVQSGQSLAEVLAGTGMAERDAEEVIGAIEGLIDLSQLSPANRVRVAFAPLAGAEAVPIPIRVSIYMDGAHQATVARNDQGTFIRADEPPILPQNGPAETQVAAGLGSRLYEAMYATAVEQQIPQPQINQLIRIFAFDLDMQGTVGVQDSIEVFHALATDDDPNAADEGILYAAVTIGGTTKRYYRFQTTDDGVIDYYDADGRSSNNFLLRKPISIGELRSGYGYRIHPILGTRTLHTGVDWAAPAGTPIVAAGDGVVVSAGWSSSYGNYTRIEHGNGYETAYAHQTRIAPGIEPGARVHQGQVIGFVGSTGLSTGPHLHYEVRINSQTVDPLRIRLPRGRVLEGDMLATFETQRREIDQLLGIADNPNDPTQVVAATP